METTAGWPQPQRGARGAPRFDQGTFLMHRNRGRKLLEEKRFSEARAELECAIMLRPRDESTLDLLGTIYYALDLRPEAATVYRSLLELHPEADVLHANLGVLEYKSGRYDDARRRLETALLLNPGNSRPHVYIGLIERAQGNLSACLKHLEAAGATELIQRLGLQRSETQNDADTGPMGIIGELSLEQCLAPSPGPPSGAFSIHTDSASSSETLSVEFSGEIRLRAGRAHLLLADSGSLHVGPPDAAGLVTMRGEGRVELRPFERRNGRVVRVTLTRGQELHVAPGRLLALEAGVQAGGSGGERELSRMLGQILTGATRLSGEGVAAISAGMDARSVRLKEQEILVIHPRDLVCWTGVLRARPASMGRLDQLLAPSDQSTGVVTLEGVGEIVIDSGT